MVKSVDTESIEPKRGITQAYNSEWSCHCHSMFRIMFLMLPPGKEETLEGNTLRGSTSYEKEG
jgi:hypothetical protein